MQPASLVYSVGPMNIRIRAYNQNAHPFTQLSYVDKGARMICAQTIEDFGFLKSLGALDIAASVALRCKY